MRTANGPPWGCPLLYAPAAAGDAMMAQEKARMG